MKQHGPCIYFDTSTKGGNKFHATNRADITVYGMRFRRRGRNRRDLEKWLKSIRGMK